MKLKSPISEYRVQLWTRRIKNFWLDYSHNKIGLVGLVIIVGFVFTAVTSPWLAPYSVEEVRPDALKYNADGYAVPAWYPIFFPATANYPPQHELKLNWSMAAGELPQSLTANGSGRSFRVYYDANITGSSDPVEAVFVSKFEYPYKYMRIFEMQFTYNPRPESFVEIRRFIAGKWRVIGTTGSMLWKIEFELVRPDNATFPFWDNNWERNKYVNPHALPDFSDDATGDTITLISSDRTLPPKLGYEAWETSLMTAHLFLKPGEYLVRAKITFKPPDDIPVEEAAGSIEISNFDVEIRGRIHGLLGTDAFGHDVWSQLLHGAAISLLFGISSAAIAVSLGILVGVTAGFVGGAVDEVMMRIVDILLCIPVLPILLVLIAVFGYSLWYLVLIIAIFGWQGLSRVIRSHVLSLREMAFVECATASGASKGYIILKHIVPNVLPTALASMVLSVPGAIILEAALSFLGFGDPLAPTWGKMLQNAYAFGAFSPTNLALWDILPPGIAIVLICMGFVFLGHAIDEVVNPRLRRRR